MRNLQRFYFDIRIPKKEAEILLDTTTIQIRKINSDCSNPQVGFKGTATPQLTEILFSIQLPSTTYSLSSKYVNFNLTSVNYLPLNGKSCILLNFFLI